MNNTKLLSFFKKTKPTWQSLEYFDEGWIERIKLLSSYLNSDNLTVCDMGCGKQWLKEHLPQSVTYIPVDYVARTSDTIVCDFDKREMPDQSLLNDVVFCSGILEYIDDIDWFISSISSAKKIIASYCTIEKFPNLKLRESYAWRNNYSSHELISKFIKAGFVLKKIDIVINNSTYCFEKN